MINEGKNLTTTAPASGNASEAFSTDSLADARLGLPNRIRESFDHATNAEIARRVETNDPTIKHYLDGARFPTYEIFLKISRATGVNLHWLMTGVGPKRVSKAADMFDEDQVEAIRELARNSGRSVDEEIKAIVLAGVEFSKSI